MFKFFRKKEKPVREYTMFEIGQKAFNTEDFFFMPVKISYYEDRIEFCIQRTYCPEDDFKSEQASFNASVKLSGERLLPFETDGITLYWDTQDEAFRRRVMPEGEPTPLISQVLLYPNEVMTMEKDFAEKFLSPLALSYATLENDTYIWYYPDGSATPAVFEMPKLFSAFNEMKLHPLNGHFLEVSGKLRAYTGSYMEKMGLTEDNIVSVYEENLKRG